MAVLSSLVRNHSFLCSKFLRKGLTDIGTLGRNNLEQLIARNASVDYSGRRSYGARTHGVKSLGARDQVITKDDKRDFMAIFPDIIRDLKDHLANVEMLSKQQELINLVTKIMQYNVSGGKNVRGLTLMYSFRMLASDEDYTEENIRLSKILGWSVEMIQGFFLVIDDLIDGATTRRGRSCWYKLEDVGFRAAGDAVVIQAEVFNLLKQHFKDKSYYQQTLDIFLDTIRKTAYGQTLDSLASKKDISELNMDHYNFISKYKTSFYTFHLPVALGMYMAGIQNPELHRQAKSVLLEIGRYFQVQDDFLDVFGDEDKTGKKGTDIEEGKCTWMAIVAFQRATPEQRLVLKESYGKKDFEKIATVKNIYSDISLPSLYQAYEEETYNLINRQIQQLSAGLPHELFLTLLHKIYGRKQ